jgi:Protein of unknown function (DUF2971)
MEEAEPEILYHYTSQEGLLGILSTKTIWATDLYYLNDVTEFKHAMGLVNEELKDFGRKFDIPSSTIAKTLRWLAGESDQRHVYVSSLSEDGNQLSQWKLYGSNYRGFSLGFDFSELEHNQKEGMYFIQQCFYDREEYKQIIRDYLGSVLSQLRLRKNAPDIQATVRYFARNFRNFVLQNASCQKDCSFSPEREWRLVRHFHPFDAEGVEFRPSAFSLIPYERIKLPEKGKGISVRRIYIGPALHQELARRSLELLLSKYEIDLKPEDIVPSDIPIRDVSFRPNDS